MVGGTQGMEGMLWPVIMIEDRVAVLGGLWPQRGFCFWVDVASLRSGIIIVAQEASSPRQVFRQMATLR
jgi:hypothetical protein